MAAGGTDCGTKKLDKLLMTSIIQNMGAAFNLFRSPIFANQQTGGVVTAHEGKPRTCAHGDAPPVLLGDVCEHLLEALYTNLYTRSARSGSFPVVECRDVAQSTSLASHCCTNKKAVHHSDARPYQMVGTERFELLNPLRKDVQDRVLNNHQHALYTDSCPQGTTNDKYRRRYF